MSLFVKSRFKVVLITVLLVIYVFYAITFHIQNVIAQELENEKQLALSKVQSLQSINQYIIKEKEISQDSKIKENKAREKLNMIRKDEIQFIFN